jgi:chromosome segregation protein
MKLKKLVLNGFKSFADRTEFDFDDGASCIVGPNGCGKSNVVDAIKWVLGEQSAKSLRGSEMMDVIFNGSTARKPSGHAEVTMVFDNEGGLLKPVVEGDGSAGGAVSITRRLYRSGNSEYLINKTPARLRDIREMFMDTGVGVDAYSVIEQGRVESFLQASQEDRRAIFDEAAGISKYKARKKEALRKLERVDQNLLRINDVLQEIQKRLRSIKYQAGKARNYQQYSEELRSLQSLFYLSQYHRLSLARKELQGRLDTQTDALAAMGSRIEQLEGSRSATELEAADLDRTAREVDGKIAAAGGSMAALVQRGEMLAARVTELGQQIVTASSRSEELEAKVETTDQTLRQRQDELTALEGQSQELSRNYVALCEQHSKGELALTGLAAQLEDEKAGTIDLFRRTSMLHNTIQGLGIRQENLQTQKQRLATRANEVDQMLGGLLTQRADFETRLGDVQSVLHDTQAKLDETRDASKAVHQNEQDLAHRLAQAREQRSAIQARCKALGEMQRRLEGVGAGVKRVLEAKAAGKLPDVLGMLGDFLQTDMDHAPLVEAALAGGDQQLVFKHFDQLQQARTPLTQILGDSASVEILCLDRQRVLSGDFDLTAVLCDAGVSPACVADILSASGQTARASNPGNSKDNGKDNGKDAGGTPATHADKMSASHADKMSASHDMPHATRVMDFVRCEDWIAPALWRLLGTTLVVADLAQAAAAAALCPAGYRFVTLAGEVLEADGRVRLGAVNRSAGIVIRRSELADLQARDAQLQAAIDELTRDCAATQSQRQHLEDLQQKLRTAIYEANTERVECESNLKRRSEQVAQLERERPLIAGEVEGLCRDMEAAAKQEHEAKDKVLEFERLSAERQKAIDALAGQIEADRKKQGELGAKLTDIKVALASSEQRRLSLRETLASLTRQREQMAQDMAAMRGEIALNRQRRTDAEAAIAAGKQEHQRLQDQLQALKIESADLAESRKSLQEKIDEIRRLLAQQRTAQEEGARAAGQLRVEVGEADVRIENLITRSGDEMHVNLLEAFVNYQHDDSRDWNAVETEIRELKARIERLGNVNLDAITEQDELEQREKFLSDQLADIQGSKTQLEELIKKINKESRDMFLATFETVRANFQDLFRKLFGGGRADIMLLDPEDVLESGIEIVARPPGKETRSLSLLSGGEKTMTALSLLFAIFKSRPSPFCLLDEVDAALDEANNERFNRLVSEFVTTSQFIIISHSKRTMSMASVLYGVTMQEPGISKRISVRFEDAGKALDGELDPVRA